MSTPELTRRGALGVVVAGIGLAGCDLASPDPGADGPSRTPVPDTGEEPSDDPDTALVESVRADLGDVLALVLAAGESRPALRRELAGLRGLHRSHLDALPGEDPSSPGPRASGTVPRLRAQVRSREEQLRSRLADAAVSSESGPLAALLASMSAAVAQRLAVPPKAGPR